jgi:hypothetical protein
MATTTLQQTRIPQLGRVQTLGFAAAALGIALLVFGYFLNPTAFFESYVFGYYVAMTIPIGSLGFLMLQHLTGGAWGVTVRRMLEAGAATLPIMGLLFIPIALAFWPETYSSVGLAHPLYEWANPEVVTLGGSEYDPLIAHKTPWLSPLWVTGRMVIYFVIWSALAFTLRAMSRRQDQHADSKLVDTMRAVSGIGIALFVVTVTFFSFDVAMSLDPHWFSTIYGAHYMVSSGLLTLSFLVLMLGRVSTTSIMKENVPLKPIHDLGKLMFAFTVLWTYMSYGQLVIIWSGDVAEFTPWYVHRTQHGWLEISLSLMVFAFFIPFFALLFRGNKRNLRTLSTVAVLVIVMRIVDFAWIILPEFRTHLWDIGLTDIAAPIGLLGIVIALFAANVQQAPLLPLNDPNMEHLQAGGHH